MENPPLQERHLKVKDLTQENNSDLVDI